MESKLEPFSQARILLENFRDSGCIVLSGESGVGKTCFALQSINESIRGGKKCFYLHSNTSKNDLLLVAQSLGFDLARSVKREDVLLIDAYSYHADVPASSNFAWPPLSKLSDLAKVIGDATSDVKEFRIVFDDVSTLLMYFSAEESYKFLATVTSRLRSSQALGLFLLIPEVLNHSLENVLPTLFDGVLQLKIQDTPLGVQRLLRVSCMKGTRHRVEWTRLEIGSSGVFIQGPEYPSNRNLKYLTQ